MGSLEWVLIGFLLGITATSLWWWLHMKQERKWLTELSKNSPAPLIHIAHRFEDYEKWGKSAFILCVSLSMFALLIHLL